VHGLKESEAVVAEDRKSDDNELVEDLFHTLGCDRLSVNKLVCLGRKSDSSDAKPRPHKIDMSSEEQKMKYFVGQKTWQKVQEGVFAKVFIHQDHLTPKQWKKRQELVTWLKERQSKGEKNLIIVFTDRQSHPNVWNKSSTSSLL